MSDVPGTKRKPPAKRAVSRRRVSGVRRGDAAELLRGLDACSVDVFCTSPPYWGLRTYGHKQSDRILAEWTKRGSEPTTPPPWDWYRKKGGQLGGEPYPEWYVAHLVEIFAFARRALKPSGSLWLNLGDTYFARWSSIRADGRQGLGGPERSRRRTPSGGWRQDKQLMLIPARVAIGLQDDGWILRNDVIWSKPAVAPRPESDRLRLSHEHLFHFVKRRPRGRAAYYYDLQAAEPGGRDVITCSTRTRTNGHSAVFPLDLIRPRIASTCPSGGLVVDPFCGTGTTLVAAIEQGRVAQGFELSTRYADLARANVRRASARKKEK